MLTTNSIRNSSVVSVARGAADDRITGLAAEIAFFGMLSLFPAAVALGAGVTFIADLRGGGHGEVERAILDSLDRFLSEDASAFTDAIRDLFDRPNGDLLTIALLVSLWSGSRGIDAIVRSVVTVAGDVERRPWWKRRLLSFGLLLGTVLAGSIAVSMLVVGPLLGGGHAIAERFGVGDNFATAWSWARLPLAAAALVAWALVLLHVSRPYAGRWRSDLSGAVTTAVLWLVSSLALRAYVGFAGSSNIAVGALGGAVVGLVWLYLLALALLVGAEVAQHARGARRWRKEYGRVAEGPQEAKLSDRQSSEALLQIWDPGGGSGDGRTSAASAGIVETSSQPVRGTR